jgi:hypothetical protein
MNRMAIPRRTGRSNVTAVKLETGSLFVRPDEDLSSIVPKFSKAEIEQMNNILSDHYTIFGDLDGHGGTRYYINLPQCGLMVSVCRTGENHFFYGGAIALINEFIKENPRTEPARWIADNARELNIAKHYWEALDLREKAELYRLKANLRACDAKAYTGDKWGINDEERKRLVTEFGYDPEKSYGY